MLDRLYPLKEKYCKCGCERIVKKDNKFILGHSNRRLINAKGRKCSKCNEYKEWKCFGKDKHGTEGYANWCKECCNKYQTEYFRKIRRNTQLKHYFGIALDEYKQILKEQNGVCAICKKAETATRKGIIKQLAVDHNHTTGIIRGLLCYKCNTTLGIVNEDQEILKNMIGYLNKYKIRNKNIN